MINQGRENEEAEKTVFSAQKLTEVIFGLLLSHRLSQHSIYKTADRQNTYRKYPWAKNPYRKIPAKKSLPKSQHLRTKILAKF